MRDLHPARTTRLPLVLPHGNLRLQSCSSTALRMLREGGTFRNNRAATRISVQSPQIGIQSQLAAAQQQVSSYHERQTKRQIMNTHPAEYHSSAIQPPEVHPDMRHVACVQHHTLCLADVPDV